MVVARHRSSGVPLGPLGNTSRAHREYLSGQQAIECNDISLSQPDFYHMYGRELTVLSVHGGCNPQMGTLWAGASDELEQNRLVWRL